MKAPSRKPAAQTEASDTSTSKDATPDETAKSSAPKASVSRRKAAPPRTRKAPAGRAKPEDAAKEESKTKSAEAAESKSKPAKARGKKGGKKEQLPTFAELGLNPKILKALDDMGYERPTPIQAKSIPYALENKDILGIAQTGTGKTGAFTLPVMHRLAKGRARARMPRCLVICPTRELAAQVAENVEQYGKYLKLEMALLIGGVSFAKQDAKLNRGVDILIATPGRLLDQFERGKILLTGVETLVVDEADRMLDMGFIPDIERIFQITPFTRQVLFFSATMPNEITRLVETFLHQPVRVEVARQSKTADTVTQRIIEMPSNDARAKRNALRAAIEQSDVKNGIVFCNRKRDVDIVAKSLTKHGHQAQPIHGDLPQSERMKTLQKFRDGELKLLCASDVAARGLDVPDVSHVFNFDVPNHAEDYVHRIGRTGRAGRKGDAVMIISPLDRRNYDDVLNLIKLKSLPVMDLGDVSLEADVRESDKRYRGKDRGGRGRDSGRSRSRSRGDKRDRPVKAHGHTADMEPVKKSKSDKTARPSEDRKPKKRPEQKKAQSKDAARKGKSKSRSGQSKGGNDKSNKPAGFGNDMPAFFGKGLK